MENRPIAVLLVEEDPDVIDRVRDVLVGADEKNRIRFVPIGSLASAAPECADGDIDLMVLCASAQDEVATSELGFGDLERVVRCALERHSLQGWAANAGCDVLVAIPANWRGCVGRRRCQKRGEAREATRSDRRPPMTTLGF